MRQESKQFNVWRKLYTRDNRQEKKQSSRNATSSLAANKHVGTISGKSRTMLEVFHERKEVLDRSSTTEYELLKKIRR